MKEKPIIFSSPMVRAILKNQKTKTRRVLKYQPDPESAIYGPEFYNPLVVNRKGEEEPGDEIFGVYGDDWGLKFPYGKPGDRLWVRESAKLRMLTTHRDGSFDLVYKADDAIAQFPPYAERKPYKFTKWTPSIHMPRWASRINLTIKSVTVERLWDMTEEEARAEGIGEYHQSELVGYPPREETWGRYTRLTNEQKGIETPRVYTATNLGAFAMLWDKLKGNWNENPWVWVIEFERGV